MEKKAKIKPEKIVQQVECTFTLINVRGKPLLMVRFEAKMPDIH